MSIKPIIFIGKSTRKHSLKLQEKIAAAGAFLNESFSSIAVIKTFNLEHLQKHKAEKKFADISKEYSDLRNIISVAKEYLNF